MKENYLTYQRKRYYSKLYVLFELVKALKSREVIFMSKSRPEHCIRGLVIKSVDYLRDMFEAFDFYAKDYNIYISTAHYDYIPNFTLQLKERSSETRAFFNKQIIEHVNGYDCLLDFDRKKDYLSMLSEVTFVKRILDTERVPHYLIPSGSGFQIVIPSQCFPWELKFTLEDNEDNFNLKIKNFVERLKTNLKLKHLDLINNGVLNRIMKAPYSLVGDRVVLPVVDFGNFKYLETESGFVLDKVYLKERGIHIFNNSDSITNKKNVTKFIYKYFLD